MMEALRSSESSVLTREDSEERIASIIKVTESASYEQWLNIPEDGILGFIVSAVATSSLTSEYFKSQNYS
jgi:hypothetical protein